MLSIYSIVFLFGTRLDRSRVQKFPTEDVELLEDLLCGIKMKLIYVYICNVTSYWIRK